MTGPRRYNGGLTANFAEHQENAMEAERLNLIETTLADLRTRAAELRRYL
jgi:hypothetical protein